jgi:hypothetical protein
VYAPCMASKKPAEIEPDVAQALTFSAADYESERVLPPLVVDGLEFELRKKPRARVILAPRAGVLELLAACLTAEAYVTFLVAADDREWDPDLLNDVAVALSKQHRSGNARGRATP